MKFHQAFLIATSALLIGSATANANERRFAFAYETTTLPKGSFEIEEQFVWESGSGFDTYDFRTEVEWGITDKFQLSLYLYNFQHAVEDGDRSTSWTGTGIEAIYQLTDPNKDAIGSAIYGEAIMNDEELELEGKILLQKNFGPLILAWNGVVEAHWENDYADPVGVLEQILGVSYQIQPSFSVGFEAKHEVEFENWDHSAGNAVFVGPNASFRKGRFFAAASCLFRVTDVEGEPNIELGTVFGLNF